MKALRFIPIILVICLALSACAPVAATLVATPIPAVTSTPKPGSDLSSAAALAAQHALAKRLGISENAAAITSIERIDWPDSCIGAPSPNEMCAQMVTPGYQVKLTADGTVYYYDTNLDGSDVRPAIQPLQGQLTEIPTSHTPGEVVSPTEAAAAVDAAVKALGSQLAVDAATIQVVSVEAVDWPDGCLGAGSPAEACLMVITPGYRITLSANGQSYEYHTDQVGNSVRLAQGSGKDFGNAAAVFAARLFLAKTLNVDLGSVTVISSEPAAWPDSCLGVPSGRACNLVLTPGYKILLSAGGKQYEVHTDATGNNVALVPDSPSSQVPALIWQSADLSCQTVSITSQGVSYGSCQGVLTAASFISPERAARLAELTGAYQSFTAETAAGKVTFTGAGEKAASLPEQRAIAEWAKLVFMEAEGGRNGAAWGLAFSWHRAGGIAGFCDDLGVYLDGEVIASSCKGQALKNGGHFYLTADKLAQLYAWTDRLQAFEVNQSNDQAVADGMTVTLHFNGSGKATTTQSDQQAVLSFASELFLQAGQSNG
jgi:hypothetical protein